MKRDLSEPRTAGSARVAAPMTVPAAPGAGTRGAPRRVRAWTAVLLVLAAAYASWASGTSPFTLGADLAVAVPCLLFGAALLCQARWPGVGPWRRMTAARPAGRGSALPWLAAACVLVALELASYFHGGARSAYPTISYGLDVVSRARAGRAALWFVWSVVGWFLARR